MKIKSILLAILVGLGVTTAYAQKNYAVYTVGFYNLENLFDTLDDPTNPGDDEFTPKGANAWTPGKYNKKLTNLAKVISQMGKEVTPVGPAVLGVAEVENRLVLEDLVKQEQIASRGYEIVHFESPDWRGIDVGLLYNPSLFRVTHAKAVPYILPENPAFKTRDQLVVSGVLAGEPLHVIVNHWPSRYGSKSSKLREHAASITKAITDSLHQIDPLAKVIIMGDLNDDPTDKSCRIVLNAKKNPKDVKPGGLFNTMWPLYEKGIGSLCYQDKWNLFDQIIISHGLLGSDYSSLRFWKAEVFNRPFLTQQEGKKKGYPFRTFSGNTFINGYSDHFPTMIYLIREIK